MTDPANSAMRLVRLPLPPAWLTALLVLLLHGGYTLATGVRSGMDTANYDFHGRQLLESGFDFVAIWSQVDPEFPAIFYLLFVTLVALLQLALGGSWPIGLIGLNLAADMLLGILLVGLAARVTNSAIAAWGALLLFLLCFDLFHWVSIALSDSTFVLLAFGIFALVAARILGSASGWGKVSALAIAGIFYRPTGIVLLPDLAWAAYLARTRRVMDRRRILLGLAIASCSGAFLFAWLMQDPDHWPFRFLRRAFDVTSQRYAGGQVVEARPETYHQLPQGLVDHVLISADRFVHFFAIGAADFSLVHWLAQLLFFLPCYFFAGWLLLALWRGDTRFSEGQTRVLLASTGAILAYALFHALVLLDYDWRYRVPVLPHFILLAAAGIADVERRLTTR